MKTRPNIKKLACILFGAAVLVAYLMWGYRVRTREEIVGGFEAHKSSFVAIAAYMESLEWDGQWRCSIRRYNDGRVKATYAAKFPDGEAPEMRSDVSAAVRVLFGKLGYRSVFRNDLYKNTITFKVRPAYLRWEYYNQGICYSIDGTEPVPEDNYDYHTEHLEPLGDGWYYWDGHAYFG